MATTPTNLPIPSEDPRDLKFNAGKIDEFVTSSNLAYTDRFGQEHRTIAGINNNAEQEFSDQLLNQKEELDAQILSQEQRFNYFIQNSGYEEIGDYEDGPLTITEYNQLIRYDGELWKLTAATDIPFTTSGNDAASWANDSTHFVNVGDAALRQELAATGGAGLIDGLAKPVTWSGFAGGADPTGVRDSTAAFLAANATKRKINIPAGTYRLTQDVVSDLLTSWEMEMGVVIPGTFRLRQAPWLAGINEQIFQYLERNSRYTCIAPTDGVGVFGTAHNDGAGSGGSAIAVAGMAYNDNTVVGGGGGAWSIYGTTVRNAGTVGSSHGMELDIANRGDEQEIYPFNMFRPGLTTGAWICSGGELGGSDQPDSLNSASVAIGIISNDGHTPNTARFLKGIVFQSKSLKGTDGTNGEGIAMALGRRHTIQWYGESNERLGAITCQGTNLNTALRLNFTDSGVLFQKVANGQTQFVVEANANTVANYVAVRAAVAGNPVQVSAGGSDTNINLALTPKGTGNVRVLSNLVPNSANAFTCGESSLPWAGGFTQTAFTVTSDEKHKGAPVMLARGTLGFAVSSDENSMQSDFADTILDAWSEVDFVQFQYLDRVEEKGADGARWHFGVIAQRAKEAFERHGLDAHRFGFLCYDEWDASEAVINEEGVVITPAVEADSRYGIRYEEALAMESALQRRTASRLQSSLNDVIARLSALESAAQ